MPWIFIAGPQILHARFPPVHGYFRGYAVGFEPMTYWIVAACLTSAPAGALITPVMYPVFFTSVIKVENTK